MLYLVFYYKHIRKVIYSLKNAYSKLQKRQNIFNSNEPNVQAICKNQRNY